jgi:hypothetical protein
MTGVRVAIEVTRPTIKNPPLDRITRRPADAGLWRFAHRIVAGHTRIADEFCHGLASRAADGFQLTVDFDLEFVIWVDRQRAVKASAGCHCFS